MARLGVLLLLLVLQTIQSHQDSEIHCGTVYRCPAIVSLLADRARLYALAFDYDSAIADVDTAIALAEENALSNETLAELYTRRGEFILLLYEWDRALADFNHALALAPDYAPAYFQRGVLYYTMAQRERALADFQAYLERQPDGELTAQARQYIESIQIELEALGH